ncbi:hypothetical protein ILYODFUR_038647, partial [Ilyodon furcidens]
SVNGELDPTGPAAAALSSLVLFSQVLEEMKESDAPMNDALSAKMTMGDPYTIFQTCDLAVITDASLHKANSTWLEFSKSEEERSIIPKRKTSQTAANHHRSGPPNRFTPISECEAQGNDQKPKSSISDPTGLSQQVKG